MATNTIPGGGGSTINIRGRPQEHEHTIDRQGQLVRLVQAKKCPCIKNGKPDIFCTICHSRGYILNFQEEYEIIEENSPHFGDTKIYPWYHPITSVNKVQRWTSKGRGGNIMYPISSFNDTEITLIDNGMLPKRHDPIRVTYSVNNIDSITNENSIHNGTYTIYTRGTEIDTDELTSNPKGVHGDISSVSRVYNKTQDFTYSVDSFAKQAIYLNPGTVEAPAPVPQASDVLEVDYKYVKPFRAQFTRIDINNSVVKYFEDVKTGDMKMIVKARYNIGRGDIVTLLTTRVKEQSVITRGASDYDEIPAFDVYDILEDIIDQDNVHYDNTKWELRDFNNLVWTTLTKPAAGKKYTIIYRYRPSYIVYRQMASPMNAGDRDYPQAVFVRYFGRLDHKDIILT